MNKRVLAILLVAVTVLAAVFFALWQRERSDISELTLLCQNGASEAYEAFKDYRVNGSDNDYWNGVAEFRVFMKAYLVLNDGSDVEYLDCNEVYGQMLLNPERVREHIGALIDAMAVLAVDYTDPSGYLKITALKNELIR